MAITESTAAQAQPSAVPAPPLAPNSEWGTLGEGLRQLAVLMFPPLAKFTKPLMVAIAAVVVLPVLLAFLAAFWLSLLKEAENPAVAGLRTWYLEIINEGFSIEEVSARSHGRLDYLHLVRHDMVPRRASSRIDMPISLQPWQKFELEFQWVEPSKLPTASLCDLPEESIDLVEVLLGGASLATLKKGATKVQIDTPWWTANESAFSRDSRVQTLSMQLTEAASNLPPCAQVHVSGSLRVYKNLLVGKKNVK